MLVGIGPAKTAKLGRPIFYTAEFEGRLASNGGSWSYVRPLDLEVNSMSWAYFGMANGLIPIVKVKSYPGGIPDSVFTRDVSTLVAFSDWNTSPANSAFVSMHRIPTPAKRAISAPLIWKVRVVAKISIASPNIKSRRDLFRNRKEGHFIAGKVFEFG